jgi:hypothetical protein
LFDTANSQEMRLELGLYSKTKLRDDATKLFGEKANPGLPGFTVSRNLLALWEIREQKTTQEVAREWMKKFKGDATDASNGTMTVGPLIASTMDLFVADAGSARYAVVGLFEVA